MTSSPIDWKPVLFHKKVEKELLSLDVFTQSKVTELLALIARGESIGLPASRPMPIVSAGAHELRIRSAARLFRIFYFVKSERGILVFHFFQKKTKKTPHGEINTARRRLGEML